MKNYRIFTIMILCVLLTVPVGAAADTWKPTKPIKLIVPWGAGGSTDQVTRVAPESWKKRSARKSWSSINRGPPVRSAPKTRWMRPKTDTPGHPAPPRISAHTRSWE